ERAAKQIEAILQEAKEIDREIREKFEILIREK
ncbi:unnamed protein product, partial [marine sediment metagenome]